MLIDEQKPIAIRLLQPWDLVLLKERLCRKSSPMIHVLRSSWDLLNVRACAGACLLPLPMDQDTPVSPATLARLSAVKRDVVATIRQAVDIVSRYAGGALPEPARGTVRSVLLRLPERWASAGREACVVRAAWLLLSPGAACGAGSRRSP